MNFLEKLDFLMGRDGLNKSTLSQASEIPYTTIDGWYKKGYEGLKLPTLRKLAAYFGTTLDYWVLDDVTDPDYEKNGIKKDPANLSVDEAALDNELISRLCQLTPGEMEKVDAFVQGLLAAR